MTSLSNSCATLQVSGGAAPLVNRDMLCFSHDWNGDPLSKTHLMRLLARDNRILWVNSIGYRTPTATKKDFRRIVQKLKSVAEPLRQVERNIFVLNPLAIPAWGHPAIAKLNYHLLKSQVLRAMRALRFRRPINWVFNPAAGIIAGALGEERIIYYCVDEYTAFCGVPKGPLELVERELLEKADLVIVSAKRLFHSKKAPHAQTVLVRHGVDYDHFRKALRPDTVVPSEIASLPKPVIGYFGLIGQDWVDIPLLLRVARSFPSGSLVLIGKVATDISALEKYPNVHVLGRKPYASLPAYCKGFDVALIPFPISDVTLNANPLKAREYLAAGLPVVSTAIPEVEVLEQCLIGTTPEAFVARVREALTAPGPEISRSQWMQSESWEHRLEEIRRHVARIGSF